MRAGAQLLGPGGNVTTMPEACHHSVQWRWEPAVEHRGSHVDQNKAAGKLHEGQAAVGEDVFFRPHVFDDLRSGGRCAVVSVTRKTVVTAVLQYRQKNEPGAGRTWKTYIKESGQFPSVPHVVEQDNVNMAENGPP